jgi:hypothetical protein
MKTVMKNLDLVLERVESELENHNTQSTKTLMNTYRNLLQRFRELRYGDSKLVEYNKPLLTHKDKLTELHSLVEDAITNALERNEFKYADNLAIISERVLYSIRDIESATRKKYEGIGHWSITNQDNDSSKSKPTE